MKEAWFVIGLCCGQLFSQNLDHMNLEVDDRSYPAVSCNTQMILSGLKPQDSIWLYVYPYQNAIEIDDVTLEDRSVPFQVVSSDPQIRLKVKLPESLPKDAVMLTCSYRLQTQGPSDIVTLPVVYPKVFPTGALPDLLSVSIKSFSFIDLIFPNIEVSRSALDTVSSFQLPAVPSFIRYRYQSNPTYFDYMTLIDMGMVSLVLLIVFVFIYKITLKVP